MTELMSIQEVLEARKPLVRRTITPPPAIMAGLFEEQKPAKELSDSQKAQKIMEANGLDGMEFGDDPRKQRIERYSVYEIIMCLLADGEWSYDRINDWCRYSKFSCRFTLNEQIVR